MNSDVYSMIEFNNVSISFDDKPILENVSCIIPENCITAIVGKSGTGKSVLMKSLLRLIEISSGEIIVDGDSMSELSYSQITDIRKKISIVFQSSALLDYMNVYQNVAFPLIEHGQTNDSELRERVVSVLERVGLHDVLEKMPSELSGGMQRRVALARSIIREPKYLIYDEPTTGLDPVISDDITDLIISLQKELDITSVVITHDLRCLHRSANRVICLDDGKKVFEGAYQEFSSSRINAVQQFSKIKPVRRGQ